MAIFDNSTYDSLEFETLISVDRWCLLALKSLINDGVLSTTAVSYFNQCSTIEQMVCMKTLTGFISANGGGGITITNDAKRAYVKQIDAQLRSEFLGNVVPILGTESTNDRFHQTISAAGYRPRNYSWNINSSILSAYSYTPPTELLDLFGSRLIGDWDVGNSATLSLNTSPTPDRVSKVYDSSCGPIMLQNLLPSVGSQVQANYDPTKNVRGMLESFQDFYQLQNTVNSNGKLNLADRDWLIAAVVDVTAQGWFFWSQVPVAEGVRKDLFVGTEAYADNFAGPERTGTGVSGLQVVVFEARAGTGTLRYYKNGGYGTIVTNSYSQCGFSNTSTYGQLSAVSFGSYAPFTGYLGGLTIVSSPSEGEYLDLAISLCNRWGIVPGFV